MSELRDTAIAALNAAYQLELENEKRLYKNRVDIAEYRISWLLARKQSVKNDVHELIASIKLIVTGADYELAEKIVKRLQDLNERLEETI